MTNLLFVQIILPFLKTKIKMINLWCNLHPKKALKRKSLPIRKIPTPLRRRNGPPVLRDPCATPEQDVSGTSRERSEDVSSLGKKSDGDALQKIINKLSDVHNSKDLHLKHFPHVFCTVQEENNSLLERFLDLYQHLVKTCPFCNSTKPRPDRSRVSGLRAEEFGDLTFFGSWFYKDWRPFFGNSDCFGWCYFALCSIS